MMDHCAPLSEAGSNRWSDSGANAPCCAGVFPCEIWQGPSWMESDNWEAWNAQVGSGNWMQKPAIFAMSSEGSESDCTLSALLQSTQPLSQHLT